MEFMIAGAAITLVGMAVGAIIVIVAINKGTD